MELLDLEDILAIHETAIENFGGSFGFYSNTLEKLKGQIVNKIGLLFLLKYTHILHARNVSTNVPGIYEAYLHIDKFRECLVI